MKKLLAIILTVVMLFGVIAISTSADETTATPKVTIITNEGSAVKQGVTTYFTVRFDNFSQVKGIDVTITADQYIKLSDVDVSGFDIEEATEGVNYTESNEGDEHTIRFVDLTGSKDGKIIFEATVPEDADPTADPTIKVTGSYADTGKTFIDVDVPAEGKFELVKEIDSATSDETTENAEIDITPAENKFIPAGGVYIKNSDNTYTFATKQTDGSFVANEAGAYTYQSYDIPTNGITTFGAQDDPEDNSRFRFGSYSNISGEHGTMVFEGNWLALKNHYIKKGYTVQQFVKAIFNNTKATLELEQNAGKSFVYYTIPDTEETINVYLFKQNKYLWKSGNVLEYAIRLDGIDTTKTYTAVAYNINDDKTVTLSEDVKSVTKATTEQ